jgi:hypothetical protein
MTATPLGNDVVFNIARRQRGSVLEAFTTARKSANSLLKLSTGVAGTIVGGGGPLEAGDW